MIWGSILMMNPLLNIAQAFAILSQEERQRKVKPHNHLALESPSLNAMINIAGPNHDMANIASTTSTGYRTNYAG